MNRRDFLRTALATAAAAALPGKLLAGKSDSIPNILLILLDDMGYGDCKVYNPESTIPMPNLEALATRGMVFTDAHSTAATCAPSRYSVLTGNYPWRGRKPGGTWRYNDPCQILHGQNTIGNLLKEAGYHTAIFGKLHMGGDFYSREYPGQFVHGKIEDDQTSIDFSLRFRNGPLDHGFDYSFILPSGIQYKPYAYFENDKLVDDPEKLIVHREGRYGDSVIKRDGFGSEDYDSTQAGPRLMEKAMDFIDTHHKENMRARKKRPFFIHYCSQVLHDPCTPPEKMAGKKVKGTTFAPPGDMLYEIDVSLGMFTKSLKERNLLDNTLVIVTSDNGGWIHHSYEQYNHRTNGALKGTKGTIWEGGHRVPLIAAWGDGSIIGSPVPPGSRSDQLVGGTDFFATFAELTEQRIEKEQGLDSSSFLPALLGREKHPGRNHLLVQANQKGLEDVYRGEKYRYDGKSRYYKAFRQGYWKLIVEVDADLPVALYNLKKDLQERNNLINNPEYKQRLKGMHINYNKILNSSRSTPLGSNNLKKENKT